MIGSISQGEALRNIISVCLACCFFPNEKQNPHWPTTSSDSSSGAAARVPSLANVEMVQKEPEATQLIKTWWLNTVGFSTIKQLISAEQFIYC